MADATATEATSDAVPHDGDFTDSHEPTPRQYVEIAAVLAVLTAMEFATYFIDFGVLAVPMLVVLMAIKFAMVVGFFMHLKFDTRIYRQLLLTGLIGAIVLYAAVMLALAEFPAGQGLG